MPSIILNADDFGGDPAINEAVEEAFGGGVLGSASLLISGACAADAVRRARRNPELKIGLHLATADAPATSPPEEISSLIGAGGALRTDILALSVEIAVSRKALSQLRREVSAQFRAFAATGLALDHVDAHRHMQLHPSVLDAILQIGAEHGTPPLRFPVEPSGPLFAADPSTNYSRRAQALRRWAAFLRRRARRRGFAANDFAFGDAWSGAFTEARLLALLAVLPPGTSELYFHPAKQACGFAHANHGDYEALVSLEVKREIAARSIRRTSYSALKGPPAR